MIQTFEVNDLILGGTSYPIKKTSGFDFPIVRTDVKDRGNYVGGVLGAYNYGRRLFSIEGEIWGTDLDDYEDKRRNIERAVDVLNGLQRAVITTKSGLTLRMDVILNNTPQLPYNAGDAIISTYRLEFVAPYPFLLSVARNYNLYVSSGGGGEIPSEIPFDMSAGLTGSTIIRNNGNAPSFPIIYLYGAMKNPVITNGRNDKQIQINQDFDEDTIITIDTYRQTARDNHGANLYQYVTGVDMVFWFTLLNGDNTITLTPESFEEGAHAVITHQDHYLGV